MIQQRRTERGEVKIIPTLLTAIVCIALGIQVQRMFLNSTPPVTPLVSGPTSATGVESKQPGTATPSPFTLDPSSAPTPSPNVVKGVPVELTPEREKFRVSFLAFKAELEKKTPNFEQAKVLLKEMVAQFSDPSARGTFMNLISSVPDQSMSAIVSIFDMQLDDESRSKLINFMSQHNQPPLNKALGEWLATAQDMVAIEKTLNLYSHPMRSDDIQNGLIALLKGKTTAQVRWLAADLLLENPTPEVSAALITMAKQDSDVRLKTHAALLLQAINPPVEGVMILDRKQFSDEKFPEQFPFLPGDILQSCDNVTYIFSSIFEAAMQKKPVNAKISLTFNRNGVELRRECLVQEILDELKQVKLYTARLKTTPTESNPNF